MKDKARKLLAEAGFTPQKPLRVEMVTRAIAVYVDMASFVINELKQVGIEATLKQIETAQWHAMATRGDYQIGRQSDGARRPTTPTPTYYENYACGSPRNYSQYCNEEVMKMIDAAVAGARRQEAPGADDRDPEEARGGRGAPDPGLEIDYFTVWPHVKNLIPHQSIYNFGRMQEVWSDK